MEMASPGNQYCANCIGTLSFRIWGDKKLSYRRGTARCVVSVAILPIAKQQCKKLLVRQVLNKSKL